jgi:hypothetical protein
MSGLAYDNSLFSVSDVTYREHRNSRYGLLTCRLDYEWFEAAFGVIGLESWKFDSIGSAKRSTGSVLVKVWKQAGSWVDLMVNCFLRLGPARSPSQESVRGSGSWFEGMGR